MMTILGGGCAYSGRDMTVAHEGLRSQNRLLAVLAPMHREVINK